MLILTFRVMGTVFMLFGSIYALFQFSYGFLLGVSALLTSMIIGLLFFAIAAVLEYLERIADNTEITNSYLAPQSNRRKNYPEMGKRKNDDTEEIENESGSALDKLLKQNHSKYFD